MRHRLFVPLAGVAIAAVPATPTAQALIPVPPVDPPSVAQLCAATGVETVDALLGAVAETRLVGALAPLVDLTVPRTAGGVELEADVELQEVRDALDCGDTTPTTTPTTTPPPPSTVTTTPRSPDDDDKDGCGRCPRQRAAVPRAPAPSIVDSALPVTG
jgi:hypothetical protein